MIGVMKPRPPHQQKKKEPNFLPTYMSKDENEKKSILQKNFKK